MEHEFASLDELVTVFDVSKNTIRRDVQELVDNGKLKKCMAGFLPYIKTGVIPRPASSEPAGKGVNL